jgi:hypothetical protein
MIRKSSRGADVDFEKLQVAQETTIAVGNVKTNARGDQLGKGGKIEKTADQIAREHYNTNNPKAVKKASIKVDRAKEELPVGLESQPTKRYTPAPAPAAMENVETNEE